MALMRPAPLSKTAGIWTERLAQENKASLRRRSWQARTHGFSERLFFRESSPLAGWVDPGRSRVQQSAARNLEGLAHHKRGALEEAEEAWQAARGLAIGRGSLAACDGHRLFHLLILNGLNLNALILPPSQRSKNQTGQQADRVPDAHRLATTHSHEATPSPLERRSFNNIDRAMHAIVSTRGH